MARVARGLGIEQFRIGGYCPVSRLDPPSLLRQKDELKEGDVNKVIAAIQRLKPHHPSVGKEIEETLGYFEVNRGRMKYAEWIKQGLFVGSGVIEAGCKTIVGQRLKQSGMRWTVQGANSIIALRCCQISHRWEEFWENRAAG